MFTERPLSVVKFLPALLLAPLPLSGCSGGSGFTASDASVAGGNGDSGPTTVVVTPAPGSSVGAEPSSEAGPIDADAADASLRDGGTGPTCPLDRLACDGGCVPNDSTNCGACGSSCTSPDGGVASCTSVGGAYQCLLACDTNATKCGSSCADTTTDPHNCGRCGHDCLAGACVAGNCQSWVVANVSASHAGLLGSQAGSALVSGGHFDLATDGKNVVWIDAYQGVLQAPASGESSGPIVNLAPLQSSNTVEPGFLAMTNGVVAWTMWDVNNGISVYEASKKSQDAGISVASLPLGATTAGDLPLGLALDATGENAYFLDSLNASNSPLSPGLIKCDFVGKSCKNIYSATVPKVILGDDVAVSGANLFWTDSSSGDVWHADSSHPTSAIATAQQAPSLLAVAGQYVYWVDVTLADADAGTASSFRINRTTQSTPGPVAMVASGEGILTGFGTDGVYVYFSGSDLAQSGSFIDYVPVDGGQPRSLKDGQQPAAMAVGGGAVFWLNYADNTIDGIAAP
jgi:hypothetical protein